MVLAMCTAGVLVVLAEKKTKPEGKVPPVAHKKQSLKSTGTVLPGNYLTTFS